MNWGMQNRLARIIKPEDNRAVMLAVDHGYFLGPTSGLEQPRKTIEPLLSYADSIMLTRGVLRTSVDPKSDKPVVLRVSGGTSILKELSNEDITVSIDDCIRLNVSAMALSIFVGSEFEKETLISLAKLVDEGEKYGIPVLAERPWEKTWRAMSATWGSPAASRPSLARISSRPITATTLSSSSKVAPFP